MLSSNKPLLEFGKLDKCLAKYGKHFECDNDKEIIFPAILIVTKLLLF